jgi:hypothetical protein
MSWVTVGVAGGGAALGLLQGKRKREQDLAYNAGQAEMTKYAPWTGNSGVIKDVADPLNSAIQGGTSGALFGMSMGGPSAAAPAAGGSSPLGGDAMAKELGAFSTGEGMQAAQNALKPPSMFNQMPTGQQSMLAGNSYQPKYGLGGSFKY